MDIANSLEAPLSAAQQALWFLDKLDPDLVAYNSSSAYRLRGPLNVDALTQAVEAIFERHPALRIRMFAADGEPVQRVAAASGYTLRVRQIDQIGPADQRESQIIATRHRLHAEPFELDGGELARVDLIKFDADDALLLLRSHHIISDGWSARIFWRELSIIYTAIVDHRPVELPPISHQFIDFVLEEQAHRAAGKLEAGLAYWRRYLHGLEMLSLPTDRRPVPRAQAELPRQFLIDAELTSELTALAKRQRVTLYMVLLGTLQILLSKYSGQIDFPIGSPIAGRTSAEYEAPIGYFVNMLVQRANLSGDPSFAELLRRVRSGALESFAHQNVPFALIAADLGMRSDQRSKKNPVFQVSLTLHNLPEGAPQLPGLIAEPLQTLEATSKFDLALSVLTRNGQLIGSMRGRPDLFDDSAVDQFAAHFTRVLRRVARDENTKLSDIELPDAGERRWLLQVATGARSDLGATARVFDLIERTIGETPDAIAIRQGERDLSYRELGRLTNAVAHRLQHAGIGSGVTVGLFFERSPEQIAAMLAALRVGAVYLPIDPDTPASRIAELVEDSQLSRVLLHSPTASRWPASLDSLAYRIDDAADPSTEARALQASAPEPSAPAYLLYTSGSTGKPKGVLISQASLCNHARWTVSALGLNPGDAVLQKTPTVFDASVQEIFPALVSGARLVLARPGGERDPSYLASLISAERITMLQLVPSALGALLEMPEFRLCDSLRWILSGGEALDWEIVDRVRNQLPLAKLCNTYGPTETTVDATLYQVEPAAPRVTVQVPIGRPMTNATVYIVDDGMHLVPRGARGEICIGGAGVAIGYWRRDELNAERFVADPFAMQPGQRLYRTGDLGRWLADGTIEFLGRRDRQLKIRGYRIEPAEIESALLAYPGVNEAVVEAFTDETGLTELTGFVRPAAGLEQSLDRRALRESLLARLPNYMVPRRIVMVEKFERLVSGKLDRKSLADALRNAIDQPEPTGEPSADTLPRTDTEIAIASIWHEVLGSQRQISRFDDFFSLGGHSLHAMRLTGRINRQLGIEIRIADLFDHPQLEDLAAHIDTLRGETKSGHA